MAKAKSSWSTRASNLMAALDSSALFPALDHSERKHLDSMPFIPNEKSQLVTEKSQIVSDQRMVGGTEYGSTKCDWILGGI